MKREIWHDVWHGIMLAAAMCGPVVWLAWVLAKFTWAVIGG